MKGSEDLDTLSFLKLLGYTGDEDIRNFNTGTFLSH